MIDLERREAKTFRTLTIDPSSDDNQAAIRWFLENSEFVLTPEFIDRILESSGGLFLHAHHLAHAASLGLLKSSDALPDLPSLYRHLLDHVRELVGEKVFVDVHQRLLASLIAAKEPLGVTALYEHWGVPRDHMESALADFAFLLSATRDNTRETSFTFCHNMVRDLVNESLCTSKSDPVWDAHKYYSKHVYDETHSKAAAYWLQLDLVDDPAFAYALLHLPYHLRMAKKEALAGKVEKEASRLAALRKVAEALEARYEYSRARLFREEGLWAAESAFRASDGDRNLGEQYLVACDDLANLLEDISQHARAAEVAAGMEKVAAGLQLLPYVAKARLRAGYAAYLASRFPEAVKLYDQAIDTFRQVPASESEIDSCMLRKAEVLYHTNEFAQSLSSCDDLLTGGRIVSDEKFKAEILHLKGRVLIALNQHKEALDSLTPALEYFKQHKMKNWEADIENFRSDALLVVGQLDDAWRAAMRAHAVYMGFGDRIGGAESAWTLGDIAFKRQQTEDAERWYQEAMNQAKLSDDPSTQLESYLKLGRFLMERGRKSEATPHLSAAKEIATNLNENSMLEEIQQLLS